MDKQTARRLLDEMPEGTTHVHGVGNYFKNEKPCKFWEWDRWVKINESSLAMQQYHESRSVERLREIAGETVTREMALQWCIDYVDAWPDRTRVYTTPKGCDWVKQFDEIVMINGELDWEPITELDWATAKHPEQTMFTMADDDPVHQPKHYEVIEGLEAIEIIASSLTRDEWKGYCVGNILKYRLRAGKKDALQQDVDKANEYEMLFDKYKELNRK